MDNPEKLATQTKKNKQKHKTICVGHNYTQADTNNLNHDTWLTVTEYLCYTSPRMCPVLLSSSGEETDYHSGIPELTQVSSYNDIKAVDLYIIYETKRRIKKSVQLYFIFKNDQHRQTYRVATRENIVSSKKLCEAHITILECLIDNVFVMLDERVFQQTVDTLKGTNCAPLNIDFFIYLHEVEVDAGTSQRKRKQLVRAFNVTVI